MLTSNIHATEVLKLPILFSPAKTKEPIKPKISKLPLLIPVTVTL